MTNIELKPCPCCGGKAKSYYDDPYDGYQGHLGRYFIGCTECNLRTSDFSSLKKAVEAWNERDEEYKDGDIYLNPMFGDLWVVDSGKFIKINDGYSMDVDEPEGFIKVGHVDGITNKRRDSLEDNPHVDDHNP